MRGTVVKPEVSIPVALATGAVVVGVYQTMVPSAADARTVTPGTRGHEFLAGSESAAFYVSVGVVGAISLIARDPVPFWVGGLMAVALSWSHRYARQVDPGTGRLAGLPQSVGSPGSVRLVQVAG